MSSSASWAGGCSAVNGRRGASRREYSDGGESARRGSPLPCGGLTVHGGEKELLARVSRNFLLITELWVVPEWRYKKIECVTICSTSALDFLTIETILYLE